MGSQYSSHIRYGLLPQTPEAGFEPARPSGAEALLSDDSRQLLTAWKTWRGERLLPHRRDMDLVSIARLMPKLVLLEAFGPQRMIFRLAGTEIETITGLRLMGRDHITLAAPEDRALRSRLLWGAASQPCGAVAFHSFPHPDSGRPHQIESFVLPVLPNDSTAPIQLIGVASRLPVLEIGSHLTLPLERAAATQHFIDIGAGIPAL
ncbi:MAG: PAS domain-containing protein [Ferrovibrio sp.]|uniref:PAS domain-containing protein n=1 Tax=Ferrovibrio sp. TaxID=1917215 RepID=UPI0026076649|nr:PAS domain-containing protein [Ferrovibrio sp.]MCW0236730.1 PAS domain-containing protein [Ferrovibrio sp.]